MSTQADAGPGESAGDVKKRHWLWPALVSVAIGGLVVAAVLLMLPGMTPDEVAESWVADNVDMLGERVAGVVVDGMGRDGMDAFVLKELGGEWVEDQVHERLVWTYSPAVEASGGHLVVATGSVELDVSMPPLNGVIEASAPFELFISENGVVRERLVLEGVSVRADVAGVSLDVSGEKVGEAVETSVDGAVEKAAGVLGEKVGGDGVAGEGGGKVKEISKP